MTNHNLRKHFDLSSISNVGLDELSVVDRLVADGRANCRFKTGTELGGLAAVGLSAVTTPFSLRTAIGTVVANDADGELVRERLESVNVSTDYVEYAADCRTCRNAVYVDETSRLCIRHGDARIGACHLQAMKSLVARSRCAIVRVDSLECCKDLLSFACRHECFAAFVPTESQLAFAGGVACDLLCCNSDESRRAWQLSNDVPAELAFSTLINKTRARYLVQTGGGIEATMLFDRESSRVCEVEPAILGNLPRFRSYLMPCGTGDVAVHATCCSLMEGADLEEAFGIWGRLFATAHLLGVRFGTVREYAAWHNANGQAFAKSQLRAA